MASAERFRLALSSGSDSNPTGRFRQPPPQARSRRAFRSPSGAPLSPPQAPLDEKQLKTAAKLARPYTEPFVKQTSAEFCKWVTIISKFLFPCNHPFVALHSPTGATLG